MKYLVRLGDEIHAVEVEEGEEGGLRARLGEQWYRVDLRQIGHTGLFSLLIDDHPYEIFAHEAEEGLQIVIGSRLFSPVAWPGTIAGRPPRPVVSPGAVTLHAPIAGLVVDVFVSAGDPLEEGALLLILEAMKMNNELRAPRAGTVQEVYVSKGQRVEQGTPLLLLK